MAEFVPSFRCNNQLLGGDKSRQNKEYQNKYGFETTQTLLSDKLY